MWGYHMEDTLIKVTVTIPKLGADHVLGWAAEKRAAARALGFIKKATHRPGRNFKPAWARDGLERIKVTIPSSARGELVKLARNLRKADPKPGRKRVPSKKLAVVNAGLRQARAQDAGLAKTHVKFVWTPTMDGLLVASWNNGSDLILTAEALKVEFDVMAARLVALDEAESIAYVRREASIRRT